jgi:hypothetical protein
MSDFGFRETLRDDPPEIRNPKSDIPFF